MLGRTTVLIALVLALALPAAAPARQAATPKAPIGLRAFLLRYEEPLSHDFSRTPSFGWKSYPKATSYEFQLATSDQFRENSLLWSASGLTLSGTSVPLALPWITGKPYSLFARVRARLEHGTTPWSDDFGFNVRWTEIPDKLPAPNGLLRWTPIDGATSYEVWAVNVHGWTKSHYVATNVSDMRDWFSFHSDLSWVGVANWRVRAVRATYGTSANGEPTTTYGRWSPLFTTNATPPSALATSISLVGTYSNTSGTPAKPAVHALMPGFGWTGVPDSDGTDLYRAYVFSDNRCVDPVMVGSVVGSPAWVPRVSGALALPRTAEDLGKVMAGTIMPKDGAQGVTLDASGHLVPENETGDAAARLDLWDRKWPGGTYYWTAVRVEMTFDPVSKAVGYKDAEDPQDACASGRIGSFGKVSQPIPTNGKNAFITGLSQTGRMTSSRVSRAPRLMWGTPLITWEPVLGAGGYEVQLSHTKNPFQSVGNSVLTPVTSTVLSLAPGTWYYRVRGLNLQMQAGARGMSWSNVRVVRIGKPSFRVLHR
ncbi:MAG: hypothetical protein WBQ14_04855 [Gaiellaceae bacterium]